MRSLFNATDDCLTPFIGSGEFNESLLLNILFQERIVVTEVHFFNSTLLADHVSAASGRPSLFEHAARQGVVIPAFRDGDLVLLDDARNRMKQYYGDNFDPVHPMVRTVLERIVSSVDAGRKNTPPAYWPKKDNLHLGESYERLVHDMIQTDKPPAYVQEGSDREQLFNRVWEGSKTWRFDCVDEAAAKTKSKGAKGLQRLELMNAIGRRFGVFSDTGNVLPGEILARCEGETRLVAEVFLKWVTQLHQLNNARAFESSVNFPVYNLEQDFIIDSLQRSPLDPGPSAVEGFRCSVELPPLSFLLQSSPIELMAIRNELGLAYLDCLRRWQSDPTQENQETVKSLLKDYCHQICQHYQSSIRQPLVASIGSGTTSRTELARDTIISLLDVSGTGLFVQAWKGVRAAYSYIRGRHVERVTDVQSRELEITLPSDT